MGGGAQGGEALGCTAGGGGGGGVEVREGNDKVQGIGAYAASGQGWCLCKNGGILCVQGGVIWIC